MPWDKNSAKKHRKGMTDKEASKWASIANSVLKSCLSDGGSQKECEGKAIRVANSKVGGAKMNINVSGSMRILAESELDDIVKKNPVLAHVRNTANGKIAVMDTLTIGQDGYPTIGEELRAEIGDGAWVFDRDVALAALPSCYGKPVIAIDGFAGHGGLTNALR